MISECRGINDETQDDESIVTKKLDTSTTYGTEKAQSMCTSTELQR